MHYLKSYIRNNNPTGKNDKLALFNQLGNRLKELRENRGISQLELGVKTGYCQNTICRKETGERQITVCDLISFSKALNLSSQEILYILGISSE